MILYCAITSTTHINDRIIVLLEIRKTNAPTIEIVEQMFSIKSIDISTEYTTRKSTNGHLLLFGEF